MGTGASKCPADVLMEKQRQKARKKKKTSTESSNFYLACKNGEMDSVKEHLTKMSKEDIDKLEGNGDTALHVATRSGQKDIVKLLLAAQCSTTTLNYDGKMAYEEIETPEMNTVFERMASTRFYDPEPKKSLATFKRSDENDEQKPKFEWIRTFKSDDELKEYSLKQQTTAMWFRFFHRVSHTFSGILNRRDFRADFFDLESDRDFMEFLKLAIRDDDAYQRTIDELKEAEKAKDIVPLIRLYTSEFGGGKTPFYEILNRQLALASEDDGNTAHMCDRFVHEFNMKSDQLEQRAYTGQTFRGASMSNSDLEIYDEPASNGEKVTIATKAFTSTSRKREEALKFAFARNEEQKTCSIRIQYTESM